MDLYKLELKRLLKIKYIRVLIIFSILVTIFLLIKTISLEKYIYIDDNGIENTAIGLNAISMKKKDWTLYGGEVTPEKIARDLNQYQKVAKEYKIISLNQYHLFLEEYKEDNTHLRDISKSEYYKKIAPIENIVEKLEKIYSFSSSKSNIQNLTEEDALNFYNKSLEYTNSSIKMHEPKNYKKLIKYYDNLSLHIKTPFIYYPLSNFKILDYLMILIFILTIVSIIIAIPIFTGKYQKKANDILYCTKLGSKYFLKTKIISCLILCSLIYLICITIYFIVINTIYGWDTRKTSIQMLFNIDLLTFSSINFGQVQLIAIVFKLLALISTVCFILLISSITKSVYMSGIIFFLVYIIQILFPEIFNFSATMLFNCILPTGGLLPIDGLIYSDSQYYYSIDEFNLFYNLIYNINFSHIVPLSFWPLIAFFVMRLFEIPILIYLTIYFYCRESINKLYY